MSDEYITIVIGRVTIVALNRPAVEAPPPPPPAPSPEEGENTPQE